MLARVLCSYGDGGMPESDHGTERDKGGHALVTGMQRLKRSRESASPHSLAWKELVCLLRGLKYR